MVLFVIFTVTLMNPKQVSAQIPYVSFQVFYDQLSPYGQWVDYSNYGYVWLPNAGPGFFPYSTGGRWIMTEYGWTWLSDYSWGWAPFHYGRWDYDSFYGWFWVPDNIWGPAWVTWRRSGSYYGWAPMGPGMNINMSYGMGYNNYNNHWTFVRERYFGRSNLHRYYASQSDYGMLVTNSTVINNTYIDNSRQTTYVSGPNRTDVQQTTGRRVTSYSIQENNVPGQSLSNGQYRTYRPQVMKNSDSEQVVKPLKVTTLQEAVRPSERITGRQQGNADVVVINRQEQQTDIVNRQSAVDQQNSINRQNAVTRQNTLDQQNAINRQNAVKRQEAVDQQNVNNTRREQEQVVVNRQNTLNRQKAVEQQKSVNRHNSADQRDAAARQGAVNRRNADDQQKAVNQQNAVNKQNTRNSERAQKQQNTNNSAAEQRVEPEKSARQRR